MTETQCPKCKSPLRGPRLVTPNPHKDAVAYWCERCDYYQDSPVAITTAERSDGNEA
jgi:hypothetical protein